MGRRHEYYKVRAGNHMAVFGTQESQSKGREIEGEDGGEDH